MVHGKVGELGTLDVDDYVDTVRTVWVNIHRRRTVLDYALHVLDHSSRLGEAVRLDDSDRILEQIAETANWLFGFVAKLSDRKNDWDRVFNIPTKLSYMIWQKYPGFCPHCFERIFVSQRGRGSKDKMVAGIRGKCRYCLADYPRVEHRTERKEHETLKGRARLEIRKIARATKNEIPQTLAESERMLNGIYESNVAISTLESIGFHLLEEAGEMARAVIDLYTKSPKEPKSLHERQIDLGDEVAEVFAWLCSLTAKVRAQVESVDRYGDRLTHQSLPGGRREGLAKKVGLEEILLLRHWDEKSQKYRCDYCERSPCICRLSFAWTKGIA